MRLTLRTLLAYLNDTLEPDQAREIGQKVNESEYASGLVKRIEDVVRKRRLTTPDLEGPNIGLGPNTVSEYLDNSLTPVDVTKVEKFCLESDLHLAELASVDQIRTLALCEPVEVQQGTRDRMYEFGPGTSASGVASASDEHSGAPSTAERPEVPVIGSVRAKINGQVELPDLPRPSRWKRLVPYACFLLIGGGWLYLMVNDFFGQSDQPTAVVQNDLINDADDMDIDPIDETDLTADPVNGSSRPASSLPTLDDPIDDATQTSDTNQAGPADATTAAAVSDPVEPNKVTTVADADPGTSVGAANDANTKPVPDPTDPSPAVVPDATNAQIPRPSLPGLEVTAADAPDLKHLASSGVLMGYDAATSEWVTQPADATVTTWSHFAVPEPFRGRFEPADTNLRVDLTGGTKAQYLGESKSAPFGLNLQQGRVVVMGDRTEFDPNKKEAIAVATHGHIWRIEILTPETTCGIEIQPVPPNQFEVAPDAPGFVGRLYVSEGSVRVVDSAGKVIVVNKLDSVSLPLNPNTEETDASDPIRSVPDWVAAEMPAMSSATRQYARLFEKEFVTGRSVVSGVNPRVNDRRPRMAELAAKCLATIGDSESLVRALSETEHEEARQAAIDGLRNWLIQSADNAATLKTQLGEFFHDRVRDDAYRLLWGFNAKDAHDSESSRELVLWLDHEHVAIRQLAFNYIRQLTGKTHQYGPSRPLNQRRKSYSNWVRMLERDGTLLTD